MKTVYLLVVALAVPLVASGQDTKSTDKVDNTNVFVQDNSAFDLLTSYSVDDNGLTWAFAGGQSGPKVDLDIRNARVEEALKELFSKAKAEYKLEDKDLPDSRISLTAKQVRFSTALKMIMETAGLHYAVQGQNGKTTYKIGKKLSYAPTVFSNSVVKSLVDKVTVTPYRNRQRI